MNTTNNLPAIANAIKQFSETVIQTTLDVTEKDTAEFILLNQCKQSLLTIANHLDDGALLCSVADNSESLWLAGASSQEIANHYDVEESLVSNAINNRIELVKEMEAYIENLPK